MRSPLTSLAFATIARALAHGGATEIGDARLKPAIASNISAASSAVRARGPCTWPGSQASGIGQFGVSPGVGRMPTMPQNEAGIRIEQPKSVPCASGTMPVATATADPPEEPAGLNAGFQGLSPAGSSGGSAVAVATGMVPLAQGTDFGCSIRIPAAFCGIIGLRPTPGLTPNYPAPLAWDVGQVHGPLARSAEDAALMLDAMVGLSRRSPISVPPPWQSALVAVERGEEARGLRIAYAPDIAGIGVDAEIDAICRQAAHGLEKAGAAVEEIDFDVSDGRDPYQTWRGAWMVGRQFSRLARLEEFSTNLKGNVKAGLKVTALDLAAAEDKRQQVFLRFRDLFERYDILLTPAAPVKPYPVEMNFPNEINGRKFENYVDWIAPAFLITLVSLPAGSVPAGKTRDGLPVGLQVVAPRFDEPRILSVAKLVQRD